MSLTLLTRQKNKENNKNISSNSTDSSYTSTTKSKQKSTKSSYTRIVTVFLTNRDKYLILLRSNRVRTMKALWAGISGIIEGSEEPIERARIEIYEEVGLTSDKVEFLKSAKEITVKSVQYKNHEWIVYPFLFRAKETRLKLNWENSEYRWIKPEEIHNFNTVPDLQKVLTALL